MQVIYRCTALLCSWSLLQLTADRFLITKVSTRLEDLEKEFITQHWWLHNRRIAVAHV
jgi:hypothetical protein